MKVWVVASDYGLNGLDVHGVYTTEPTQKEVDRFAGTLQVTLHGKRQTESYFTPASSTGYGGTNIYECELDGPLQ